MTDHHIQVVMLILQALALFGLVIYAIETYKIRNAAQKQVRASNDQVEGLSKPCLTFVGELRDGNDVILQMHGAVGNVVAKAYAGSYLIINVGSGVALNIRYQFTRQGHQPELRYIPLLASRAEASLIEPVNAYNGEHRVTFDYESIGGRKYRTTIDLNHRVITSFEFKEVDKA
jgi:hypothetical protein